MECLTCRRSGTCELQQLSQEFGVEQVRFQTPNMKPQIEDSAIHLVRDNSKCVLCRRCVAACQNQGVGVIGCNERGFVTEIGSPFGRDLVETACISCGQCVYQCPFGAIVDKSYITDVIRLIRESDNNKNYHVYAIVAPSIASQYDTVPDVCTEQAVTGIRNLGFHAVLEAAWGADMVAYLEAQELVEKGFLTSSCCPGFVDYIHKNYPEIVPKISHNLSPMAQLGKVLKQMDPGCKTVFIGPCIAKKNELRRVREFVDSVITFEELQALFNAKDIDISTLEGTMLDNASYFGRIFARSGGLSEAVAQALKEHNIPADQFTANPIICNGLAECDKALRLYNTDKLENNFIEGMCCSGGCIGGPGCINHSPKDANEVTKYGKTAIEQTIKSSISVLEGF